MGRSRRPDPRSTVLLIVAGLLGAAVIVWSDWLALVTRAPLTPTVPWWLLTPLFAATEVVVLHVQVRRQAQSITLSEIPLVLALFLAAPVDMFVAGVLGPALIYVFYRRQSVIKALFNVSLRILGVTVTLVVFQECWRLGIAEIAFGPAAWTAAIVAVTVSGVVDGVLVLAVIGLHDGAVNARDICREVMTYLPISALTGCLGVVAVAALHADPRIGLLLMIVACALLAGYRAHATLSQRHVNLAGLFAFGRTVSTADRFEDILGSVLDGTRQLLRAEAAEVILRGSRPGEPSQRWMLASGAAAVAYEDLAQKDRAVWATVLAGDGPLLLARGERGGDEDHLSRLGYREGIVVPLLDDSGVLGALMVADRIREAPTFDTADLQMLETVANQASLALRNGRLLDRLRHDALHDVLTGLPTRVKFGDAIAAALADLNSGGDGFAVLLIDLDGFKQVNDSLGHHTGDMLLIQVAERLTRTAGQHATVARLGGDEFAIVLPTAASAAAASAIAGWILHAVGETVVIDGVEVHVGASIGISLAPVHATDSTVLLRHADHAMYAAKANHGGIRIHDHTDGQHPLTMNLVPGHDHAEGHDGR